MTAPLRLERTFDASAPEVFDAWTNPLVLQRWWAAFPTWDSPGCEVDLRVGGRYRLQMRDPETERVHIVGGTYHEIDRPNRLVYSWCWEGDDGANPGHESLVTVHFAQTGERTTVVLEHTGLPSDESREQHGAGWLGTFDNLERRVLDESNQPND
ncbi:MAG: SRPBCC domain-containing protein [Solirubrobacteraceae bacterium]|jgi:uncharacterized protein YndB with AHSA1/START domain